MAVQVVRLIAKRNPPFQALAMFSQPNISDAVETHVSAQIFVSMKKVTGPPIVEEASFTLACVSTIGGSYNKNPGAYMKRQREEEEATYRKTKRICAAPDQLETQNSAFANVAVPPVDRSGLTSRSKMRVESPNLTEACSRSSGGHACTTKRDDVDDDNDYLAADDGLSNCSHDRPEPLS